MFKIPQFLKRLFLFSFLLTLISFLITLTVYWKMQPEIPLFYSLPTPPQHLAPKEWLFFFPALSLAINLSHLFILGLINKYDRLVLQLYAGSTAIIQTLLTLALLRIVAITL